MGTTIPTIGLFGTGEKEYGNGGSGIKILLEKIKSGDIKAKIGVIVSNYENGGIKQKAVDAGMEDIFHYMSEQFPKRGENGEYNMENLLEISGIYNKIMKEYGLKYIFLSGWLRYVCGIPFNKVINIHPGPTQEGYGGKGMHGQNIHNKIWEDYISGKINQTCFTMNYATNKFDDPRFTIVQVPVTLDGCENAGDVQRKVNKMEHETQWKITQLIVSQAITWTGNEDDKIQVNMEKVNELYFPEGTVFAGNIDLKEGISYNS